MWYRIKGFALVTLLSTAAAAACVSPAWAALAAIHGRLVDGRAQPVAHAVVTLAGANLVLHATTRGDGTFTFGAVDAGEYDLSADVDKQHAAAHIVVAGGDASALLVLAPLKTIGRAIAVSQATATRSGGSLTLTAADLMRSPSADSVANVLAQLPAAARGSNGQIHLNGDHGDVNYQIDGVTLPQSLNRVIGSEVDLSQVVMVDVLEGAYPAQYGGKFAAVVNLATVSGAAENGASYAVGGDSYGGSFAGATLHRRIGERGGLSLSLHNETTGWALDPPVRGNNHDAGSASSQFARVTLPSGTAGSFNLDLGHSYQTFQIPPDTANGVPASADDVETQNDTFAILQWQRAIDQRSSLALNAGTKVSRIRDFADLATDLSPAADDRTATSYMLGGAYRLQVGRHALQFGANGESDAISKRYNVNQLVDDAPNSGRQYAAYAQDGWQISPRWRLDAGLRYDMFALGSASFLVGYAQTSPRAKLTRTLGARSSAYVYYGRLFTPFSLENISPANARILNPSSGTGFDLKPERDSLYEIGGHFPLGGAQGSWRVSHKVARDLLDDGQVGATNIHQDVNFAQGAVDLQTLLLEWPHGALGRAYLSLTHSRAVNRGCGSSLLIDCSQFSQDWTNADHDQRWSATGGIEHPLAGGGWLSLDGEYGSGLSESALCDACKVPPHVTFDAAFGHPLSTRGTLVFRVRNLLDDRYAITIDSSLQGTHYAQPRTVEIAYRFRS
ncbi:TonB-dependent receptor [bacterium]|nr:MAG: TonB-dependent receptor [bacterium]